MSNIRLAMAEQNLALNILIFSLPVVLVLSLFHGCDVRHPLDKRACKAGSVEACLSVARAYDGVGPDDFAYIFSMIFGYHHAAKVWYGHACQLGSAEGCHRFGRLSASDGDDWFDSSLSEADELTGLTHACSAHAPDACDELGELYASESELNVDEPTESKLFAEGCTAGVAEACFRLGLLHWNGRGGFPADPQMGRRLVAGACDAGASEACNSLRDAPPEPAPARQDGGATDAGPRHDAAEPEKPSNSSAR